MLATLDDLQTRIGRVLDGDDVARALAMLEDASAAVVSYTGQTFEEATTTDRLKVKNGTVRLPQRPTTAVDAIANTASTDLAFTWDHGDTVYLGTTGALNAFEIEPFRRAPSWVDVTYTHGYETIPADIVAVVCQIAGRAFGRQLEDAGMQSESIAGYSYSIGTAGAAGGLGMLADERAVLDRYKRVGGSIRVAF